SQGALQTLRSHFDSGRVSEADTLATIRRGMDTMGELLCPHSAIGVHVADAQRDTAVPMITLATAHPAKFPDAVNSATGVRPPLPQRMADLYERPERVTQVPNDLAALEHLIKERIAQ
ncbi:MAG: threonine synthase, partial [Paracoccaceae bacterium]